MSIVSHRVTAIVSKSSHIIAGNIAAFFNISNDKALDYLTNTILYSHGLLVAIVSGVMKSDRQDAKAACMFVFKPKQKKACCY